MFYPVESLKRGGRFYMCWVADSWPLRFAAITHKQLWSQDIRKLCDDLMEVVTNESGRPINRFSLRLSSQLMRGLVRLYERKVTVFLGDLCMLNAHVFKNANKKSTAHEATHHARRSLPQLVRVQVEVVPPNGQTVEEMLQNSGNVVVNIQDITLKEAAIPEFILPPNDGFGEENPDQALQLLGDRTVEQMLQQTDTSTAQHSALGPLDRTAAAEQSHDKSRLQLDVPTMERISEHDITLFRKSTAEGLQPPEEIEKDMPAIPDIPPPVIAIPAPAPEPQPQPETEPVPEPIAEKQTVEPMEQEEIPPPEPQKDQPEPPQEIQPEKEPDITIELEELHQSQLATRKRRAKTRLIIDKRTKLSGAFLRARIDNLNVELRCEDSSEDIADVRVPWELLSRRPARAGGRLGCNVASTLVRLYQTRLVVDRVPYEDRLESMSVPWELLSRRPARAGGRLGCNVASALVRLYQTRLVYDRAPYEDRVQRALPEPTSRQTRAILDKIPEEEEPVPPVPAPVDQSAPIEQPITAPEAADLNVTGPREVIGDLNMTGPQDLIGDVNVMAPRDLNVTGPHDVIGDLNVTGPRDLVGDLNVTVPQERPSVQPMEVDICELPTQKLETLKRASDYEVAAKRPRLSGYTCFKESQKQRLQKEVPEPVHQELDKENIPPEVEQPQRLSHRNVSTLLQEAGLADMHPRPETIEQPIEPQRVTETRRKEPSESSETPLGSLDRTKVSLGDSVQTTDSQRFIRNQWGIEGTMTKILNGVKAGRGPVTVESLIEKGPVISGYRNIIVARCFSSILKLKQHSFIKMVKDPDTLEIRDITLGPMFDGIE